MYDFEDSQPLNRLHTYQWLHVSANPEISMIVVMKYVECAKYGPRDLGGLKRRRADLGCQLFDIASTASIPSLYHLQYTDMYYTSRR